jgi:hypothetical protein
MGLGVVPALCLCVVWGATGCGGTSTTPARDAGADRGPDGTVSGTGGTTTVPGTGGTTSNPGSGGAASGTGGSVNPGAGGTGTGTGGGAAGTGGSAGGADAADMGSSPDASFPFDLPIPTDLTLPDGEPAIVQCPSDVATAACTTNMLCLRSTGGANPEACLCQAGHWFCPSFVDAGAGGVTDAGFPDVAGVASCQPGTTNGVACAAENEVCLGGPGLGCLCTPVLGTLRWLCL